VDFAAGAALAAVSGVNVAILPVLIDSSQCFAGDYHNPTRERGTHEGRGRERRKSIPRLRFGL
jgi:hypothetical protein